ncbi:hypothetical protein [Kitasatospora sp. NPDC057198]|uniref:hypothetical protein n=1 Tax=Kitasatospora sp. NPDC057198 TaxID=3346046 RepID=UPI003632139D
MENDDAATVAEFAKSFRGLVGRLDVGSGWCAVFVRRDPDAFENYLEGVEVPPWDVVASLLGDFSALFGPGEDGLGERALTAHAAAQGARDRLVGASTLTTELGRAKVLRDAARARLAELVGGRPGGGGSDPLSAEIAWARDEAQRAEARCEALRGRLEALIAAGSSGGGPVPVRQEPEVPASVSVGDAGGSGGVRAAVEPQAVRAGRWRGPRSAGVSLAALAFGTLAASIEQPPAGGGEAPAAAAGPRPVSAADRARAGKVAAALRELRAVGQGGRAHTLLCEAVGRPAVEVALVAQALEEDGQEAEVATLLWEAGCLPVAELAAVVQALADAGRSEDAQVLVRHASALPAADVALLAEGMWREQRRMHLDMLLRAVVRSRGRQEAVEVARRVPELVPVLVECAQRVSVRAPGRPAVRAADVRPAVRSQAAEPRFRGRRWFRRRAGRCRRW